MRIFSKKAYQFDHPAGAAQPVVVQAGSFADVPEWVADSTMFKLASQDDSVMAIESKQDELAAETGAKSGKGSGKDKAGGKNKNDDETKTGSSTGVANADPGSGQDGTGTSSGAQDDGQQQ